MQLQIRKRFPDKGNLYELKKPSQYFSNKKDCVIMDIYFLLTGQLLE